MLLLNLTGLKSRSVDSRDPNPSAMIQPVQEMYGKAWSLTVTPLLSWPRVLSTFWDQKLETWWKTMLAGEMPWFQNSKRAQHEDAGKKKKIHTVQFKTLLLKQRERKRKKRPSYQGHHKTLNQILTETAVGTVKKRDVGFETVQL